MALSTSDLDGGGEKFELLVHTRVVHALKFETIFVVINSHRNQLKNIHRISIIREFGLRQI